MPRKNKCQDRPLSERLRRDKTRAELTIHEASELVKLAPTTLYGYIERGVLPRRQRGERLLYLTIEDLARLVPELNFKQIQREVAAHERAQATS